MSSSDSRPPSQRRVYPALNLEQAVERARILYERERMNQTPINLVVQHWGYKSIRTGPASSAYSAVKQFGLIEEVGAGDQRKASVSQLARAIITGPPEVREEALRRAALQPLTNRLVWTRYGALTGSLESFRWHLTSELGFSDTGAREFAKQYEATVRFADLQPETLADDLSLDTDEDLADTATSTVVSVSPPVETLFRRPQTPSPGESRSADSTSANVSRHAIPLIGGQQVVLEGEFPITEEAWVGFLAVLAAFKPGLVSGSGSSGSTLSTNHSDSSQPTSQGEATSD